MKRDEINYFVPFADLAQRLLTNSQTAEDGAHDLGHLVRVWKNAKAIQACEGGDPEVLVAAVLLHDCVSVPKDSPDRRFASRLAADEARSILVELAWSSARIRIVAHAILTHSYSAGLEPMSLEGRILQDADRLDAIGAVGIARCFYTAGRLNSRLYEASDPEGKHRDLNDAQFALDHFPLKLLRLAEGFKTNTGQRLAGERHEECLSFYLGMLREIS